MNDPSITGTNRKVPKKPPRLMLELMVPRVVASTDRRQAKELAVEVQLEPRIRMRTELI
jgi:hypothetical protein